MAKISNPFIVVGEIPDQYFCDRKKETEWLVSSVTNGNNIVLISPRRMGKTSLVDHCYATDAIGYHYHTFYVDILSTSSLSEMIYLLSRKIYETLLPKGKKIINKFLSQLSSIKGSLGYDAISGMPTFTLSSGAVTDPILTLEQIFGYLSTADKPCIITIDEFQQISRYPEKNVEALLRSYIQKCRNCHFVFSGSERHMMINMFNDSSRPFYNSATTIDLQAIPSDVYSDFIQSNFAEYDKSISADNAQYIYKLVDGNTYYVQRICNICFDKIATGTECTRTTIEDAVNELLEMNQTYFRERLSFISAKHKPLLYAIASVGSAKSILSAEFINSHSLTSASAVQNASRQLTDNGLITCSEGIYSLTDKLLALWIRRNLL